MVKRKKQRKKYKFDLTKKEMISRMTYKDPTIAFRPTSTQSQIKREYMKMFK